MPLPCEWNTFGLGLSYQLVHLFLSLVIAAKWDWRGGRHERGGRVELGAKEAMNNLTNVLEKVSHNFVI